MTQTLVMLSLGALLGAVFTLFMLQMCFKATSSLVIALKPDIQTLYSHFPASDEPGTPVYPHHPGKTVTFKVPREKVDEYDSWQRGPSLGDDEYDGGYGDLRPLPYEEPKRPMKMGVPVVAGFDDDFEDIDIVGMREAARAGRNVVMDDDEDEER